MVGGSENIREGAVGAPDGVVVRKLSGGTEENQRNLCYCSYCAGGKLERGKRQTPGYYRQVHLPVYWSPSDPTGNAGPET